LAVASKAWQGETLCMGDLARGLGLTGLVGMIDPPRPEAIAAVKACQGAGIVVKMITGDHLATARAVGRQLGLEGADRAVTGAALAELDPLALRAAVTDTAVFARVAPEHKLRLVRALQAAGQVVAMTGDGVNDAPALKQANIGVAMGIAGSAVAKDAADVVLTDDNFASIVAAVEEGRRVFDNLTKSLAFVLPTNLGLALILTCALLFFPSDVPTQRLLLPMQPTQILRVNLVATVALALPLAFEALERDAMRRPPRDPQAPILSPFVALRTAGAALVMTGGAVGLFLWEYNAYLRQGAPQAQALAEAQTIAVTAVIMFQIFYLLHCRSLRDSLFGLGLFGNPWVFLGIGALLALQAAFIYAPPLQAMFGSATLGVGDLLDALLVGAVILPLISIEKRLRRDRARLRG
jgi:magnesium-transporting ATPase (P-type)